MWAIWYEPAKKTPRSFAFRNLTRGWVMVCWGEKGGKWWSTIHDHVQVQQAMATCSDLRAHPWGPQGRRRRWGKSGRNQGDDNACFATIMYIVGLNKNWRCLYFYLHLPVEFCPHPQLFLASRFLPCTLSSPCWMSSFPPSVCIVLSDLSKGKIYHMYHRFKIF